MPTQVPLFQELFRRMSATVEGRGVRRSSIERLALLVTGIIAARSCVVAQVAAELLALKLTGASVAESIERRLRRTLNDRGIDPRLCYEPVLRAAIDWQHVLKGSRRVVLVADESSKEDEVHLLRVSLAYRGGSLPLVWAVWEQNQSQPEGSYWAAVDMVLQRVAALLPLGLEVIVVADRAYDNPPFVDRIAAMGWHWAIRVKAEGSLRFLDHRGREHGLRELVRQHLPAPGRRWKAAGRVFKDAGWRKASVVGLWAEKEDEPLVVITDMPCRWEVLELYGRRFWIEPGFRTDKKRGWHWEDSQVRTVEHNERLLTAMAWASLLMLCLGAEEAEARRQRARDRAAKARARGRKPASPQHARHSLFSMGLAAVRQWLYGTTNAAIRWLLTHVDAVSWNWSWLQYQAHLYLFGPVRP